MFRPLILRRHFSLLNRVPHAPIVRSAARHGHDSIIIQRVRIRRPFFSKTRLVGTVFIAAATYGLAQWLGLEVKIEEVEEGKKDEWEVAGTGTNDDDEEDDGVILFLPTGLSRPGRKVFYKGSDPEWQTFRKLAQDRPRIERIRGELIAIVRNSAQKKQQLVTRLGKIDTTKGNAWIEVQFPNGPPTVYERPGIELTENLEWRKATRPVETTNHHRLHRLLYPKATADALYKDTARKSEKAWKNLKIYMGWDQETKTETVQEIFHSVSANRQSAGPTTSVAPNPFSASATDTQQPSASPSAAPADGPASVASALPNPKNMTLDLAQFSAEVAKAYPPLTRHTTRGCFIMKGLIDVYGERARLTLGVNAVYDPKQGKFIAMATSLWNYVEHRQHPPGGA